MNKVYFFLIAVIVFFTACSSNECDVDTSGVDVKIKVKRFENDLFKFKRSDSLVHISALQKKYKSFFDIYNYKIIRLGDSNKKDYTEKLMAFLKYCNKEKIYETVSDKFKDFDKTESQIIDFFKHYKYYFPEYKVPEIYTCISAFNESVFTADSAIGIALDKYLGYDCDYYFKLNWDDYIKKRLVPEMIVVDLAEAVVKSNFVYNPDADNMLENIIYSGKVQYLVNCMLPDVNDTLKFKYTKQNLRWAKANEKNIWDHLVGKRLLFNNDKLTIKQYIGEAPFTASLSNKSAPRAGVFIGYKIVKSYMKNNPQKTLKDLMNEKDARRILQEAKYSPN